MTVPEISRACVSPIRMQARRTAALQREQGRVFRVLGCEITFLNLVEISDLQDDDKG